MNHFVNDDIFLSLSGGAVYSPALTDFTFMVKVSAEYLTFYVLIDSSFWFGTINWGIKGSQVIISK